MKEILGYGEDALTLWALKKYRSEILNGLNDKATPSDCVVFFRPSFGRSGGEGRAEFGELDSILASSKNVYLIESKWDNLSQNQEVKIKLADVQILRHEIFSWHFMNWSTERYSNWSEFSNALQDDFRSCFPGRKIAPDGSILAQNLEFVLNRLHEHGEKGKKLRNVLLYFYNKNRSTQIEKVIMNGGNTNFEVINIDYEPYILGNFIFLD